VRQYNQGKTPRNIEIISRRVQLDPDMARSLCWVPIRNDGAINTQSLLEFQKWGVEQGHQIRIVSDREYGDLEFARKATSAAP